MFFQNLSGCTTPLTNFIFIAYPKRPKSVSYFYKKLNLTQPVFTCSKLTIETLEQGVKYVQSEFRKIRTRNNSVLGHFLRSGRNFISLEAGECNLPIKSN